MADSTPPLVTANGTVLGTGDQFTAQRMATLQAMQNALGQQEAGNARVAHPSAPRMIGGRPVAQPPTYTPGPPTPAQMQQQQAINQGTSVAQQQAVGTNPNTQFLQARQAPAPAPVSPIATPQTTNTGMLQRSLVGPTANPMIMNNMAMARLAAMGAYRG